MQTDPSMTSSLPKQPFYSCCCNASTDAQCQKPVDASWVRHFVRLWFSAFSMVDTPYWALTCDTKVFILCAHSHVSTSDLLVFNHLSVLYPGTWPIDYWLIGHHSWIHIHSNLRVFLLPHTTYDHLCCSNFCPLVGFSLTTLDWGHPRAKFNAIVVHFY